MSSVFKIKRLSDNLYATGGNGTPKFAKNGKVWVTRGALMGHLSMHKPHKTGIENPYAECVVEEFVLGDGIQTTVHSEILTLIRCETCSRARYRSPNYVCEITGSEILHPKSKTCLPDCPIMADFKLRG